MVRKFKILCFSENKLKSLLNFEGEAISRSFVSSFLLRHTQLCQRIQEIGQHQEERVNGQFFQLLPVCGAVLQLINLKTNSTAWFDPGD